MLHLVLVPQMRIRPFCFRVFAAICVYLYCIFIPSINILICYFSDLSTVVTFLSIVFANYDFGLMLHMLAIAYWVFEGGVISSIAYSVRSSCILMVYGGLSMSLCFWLHILIWVGSFCLLVFCHSVLMILPSFSEQPFSFV